ncbi:hypothetical protein HMPREF1250_2221 [Megasphaera vaginalis (ex Srinivasan et al. 2021)]|uniref:Uncharacterized protein n=1 Tax=Megasphaera vaginalis (ex Srinivasan et al. 2021) TaxID=1111454 RepID=U7UQS5_9FIRM|nr:hypothetical protein HMPREF1250_2221 [Megasphaera vaginalis (ex Srinivasan et al. 2021)]
MTAAFSRRFILLSDDFLRGEGIPTWQMIVFDWAEKHSGPAS